ncbi:MAG: hypothetical protein PHX01_01980 [Clostridia bacterium]|nr:hypothetical protein [Clostridia bacterium]
MKSEGPRKKLRKKAEEILKRNGYVGISEKGSGAARIMGTNFTVQNESEVKPELNERKLRLESESIIRPAGEAIHPLGGRRKRSKRSLKDFAKAAQRSSDAEEVVAQDGVAYTREKVVGGELIRETTSEVSKRKGSENQEPIIIWERYNLASDTIEYGYYRIKQSRSLKDLEKAAQEKYIRKAAQEFSVAEVSINKKTLARLKEQDSREGR